MIYYAVEIQGFVHVYNDKKQMLFMEYGQLVGFTSSTVSVKRYGFIMVYDVNHRLVDQVACN